MTLADAERTVPLPHGHDFAELLRPPSNTLRLPLREISAFPAQPAPLSLPPFAAFVSFLCEIVRCWTDAEGVTRE